VGCYNIERAEIVSAYDKSELSGAFILGTGSFGGEESYVVMLKHADGGISKRIYPYWRCRIYETAKTPYIEKIEDGFRFTLKIYVPKNTIIREFRIK
jgi:hypothetical protein